MKETIYTIGYTGFSLNEMLKVIKDKKIDVLIDVRSSPYSQRYPDYNKADLAEFLKQNKIYYRNYAYEFGARQEDYKFYSDEGYLDFEKFALSEQFKSGIKKIEEGIKKGFKFVLMCAEKDPLTCHRTILVAREFYKLGHKIVHLLPNSKSLTQEDIENLLLEKYFPLRNQITIDNMNNLLLEDDYIDQAYRQQNKKIAFRLEEEI